MVAVEELDLPAGVADRLGREIAGVVPDPALEGDGGVRPLGGGEEAVRQRGGEDLAVGGGLHHHREGAVRGPAGARDERDGGDPRRGELPPREGPEVRGHPEHVAVDEGEVGGLDPRHGVVVGVVVLAPRRRPRQDLGAGEVGGVEAAGVRVVEDLDPRLVRREGAAHAGVPDPRHVRIDGAGEDGDGRRPAHRGAAPAARSAAAAPEAASGPRLRDDGGEREGDPLARGEAGEGAVGAREVGGEGAAALALRDAVEGAAAECRRRGCRRTARRPPPPRRARRRAPGRGRRGGGCRRRPWRSSASRPPAR